MKNFFDFFLLPTKFSIDLSELEKKYFEFQHRFHPDKSSAEDLSHSITINEAYKTLSDDFLRACYLLKLNGIDILHDEKAVRVDLSTLERILELQEKISEMKDKSEIEKLRKELNTEFKALIFSAMQALESSEINGCAQMMVKAKYLRKSLEDLKISKQKI